MTIGSSIAFSALLAFTAWVIMYFRDEARQAKSDARYEAMRLAEAARR